MSPLAEEFKRSDGSPAVFSAERSLLRGAFSKPQHSLEVVIGWETMWRGDDYSKNGERERRDFIRCTCNDNRRLYSDLFVSPNSPIGWVRLNRELKPRSSAGLEHGREKQTRRTRRSKNLLRLLKSTAKGHSNDNRSTTAPS